MENRVKIQKEAARVGVRPGLEGRVTETRWKAAGDTALSELGPSL